MITHRKHIYVGGIKYSIGKWVLYFAIILNPVKIIYICTFTVLLIFLLWHTNSRLRQEGLFWLVCGPRVWSVMQELWHQQLERWSCSHVVESAEYLSQLVVCPLCSLWFHLVGDPGPWKVLPMVKVALLTSVNLDTPHRCNQIYFQGILSLIKFNYHNSIPS